MTVPANVEAEQALLGSMLVDPSVIKEIDLEPEDFHLETNRWIYTAMKRLEEANEEIDTLTLCDALRRHNQLAEVGGEAKILGLVAAVPTSLNAKNYAAIVKRAAVRRKMIATASTIANIASDESEDLDDQLSAASNLVIELGKDSNSSDVKDPKSTSMDYLDFMERAAADEGGLTGLETGFLELDMFIRGLQPTLYVIAARPGMGKSSWIINVADHVALTLGLRVLLFSLEMNSNQIMQRIVARRTGIDLQSLRSAKLSEANWKRVHAVIDMVHTSDLFIDETPGLRPSQAMARASRLHAVEPLSLILYDHLHLMVSDKYDGNPVKEVGEISRRAFEISKELGVPGIMAAQLNRGVEDRKNKRPTLRDLRDSGEIEQNAYGVLFPYRDDYYYPNDTERAALAEINVAKNRDGPTGTIELLWHRDTASFGNIVRQVI